MAFVSVGSTRIILALASRSSYILERASGRTLALAGRCMMSKS